MAKKKAKGLSDWQMEYNRKLEAQRRYEAEEGFQPFPSVEDVFSDGKKHSEFFLPAATVNLNLVSPELKGTVHFVLPIEPFESSLGEESTEFHTQWCFSDWLGFKVDAEGKYEFLADFRYFHKAYYEDKAQSGSIESESVADLVEHYRQTKSEFEKRRNRFQTYGFLPRRPDQHATFSEDKVPLVNQLGGESIDGNWSHNGDPTNLPINRYPDSNHFPNQTAACTPGRVVPSNDGRDFFFVGSIELGDYLGDVDGVLMLFYDPVERIAVEVLDW